MRHDHVDDEALLAVGLAEVLQLRESNDDEREVLLRTVHVVLLQSSLERKQERFHFSERPLDYTALRSLSVFKEVFRNTYVPT